jgi:hypothetical protein
VSLKRIIAEIARRIPVPAPRGRSVPTERLAAFARGLLSGAFTVEDIDRTNSDQMNLLATFNATLIVFGDEHQRWCDANEWARADHDRWEKANRGELTPEELGVVRTLARVNYPPPERNERHDLAHSGERSGTC